MTTYPGHATSCVPGRCAEHCPRVAPSPCDTCGKKLSAEAIERGWPIGDGSGRYICPSCYGEGGHCPEGHVLPANVDSGECPRCVDAIIESRRAECASCHRSGVHVDTTAGEIVGQDGDVVATLPDGAVALMASAGAPSILLCDACTTCDCGEVYGEQCEWSGLRSETVVVEVMPEQHHASHAAAGGAGTHPHDGSIRIRVSSECADRLLETDGDWASIIEDDPQVPAPE